MVDRNTLDCFAAQTTALPYPKNIYIYSVVGLVFMLRDTMLQCVSMITTPSPSNEMLIFTSIFEYTQITMAHGAYGTSCDGFVS